MTDNKFTFKDTGIEVKIQKVSPLLLTELDRRFPPPKPPRNKVIIDGKEIYEENKVDPDYLDELAQYESIHEMRVRRLVINRGVDLEMTAEQVRQTNDLREFWKETYGKELEGTDREVYVSYIAIGTPDDMNDLIGRILRRSQPTEEAIEEAEDRFPSDLQESSANGHARADERLVVQPEAGG